MEDKDLEKAYEEAQEETIELTKEELLANEVADLKERLLRNAAELENFKRRTNEERIRERKYASMPVLGSLIQVLGNFDKAVNFETEDQTLKNWLYGFKMINSQIFNVLEQEGVKYIESVGKQFDPNLHQSIGFGLDESKEDGIILEEITKGYMYKDRVLVHSMVKINKLENN